jgi:competence protein ComEC
LLGIYRAGEFYKIDNNHIRNLIGAEGEFDARVVYDSKVNRNVKTIINVENKSGYLLLESNRFVRYYSGQRLRIKGLVKEPPQISDFDYARYLEDHNTFGIIRTEEVTIVSDPEGFQGFIADSKKSIINYFDASFPQPHATLLTGMLIGDVNSITVDFNENLTKTGTTHIVAVSGYNITLILSSMLIFSGYIGKRRLLIISFLILTVFVFLVGTNNLSALRAYLMGVGIIIANLAGRKGGGAVFLLVSAAVTMYISPRSFLDIGFQLSYFATIGLFIFTKPIKTVLANLVPRGLRDELAVILAANSMVVLIILKNFNMMNVLSIFINLLISPFIPLVTLTSFISILTSQLLQPIRFIFNIVTYLPVNIVVQIIKNSSKIDYFVLEDVVLPDQIYLLFFIIILCIGYFLNQRLEYDN